MHAVPSSKPGPKKARKPKPKPEPESDEDFSNEEDLEFSDGDHDISDLLESDEGEPEPEAPKRALGDQASTQPRKKSKTAKSDLYKPPTAEELNNLKEVETLFHSNLFGLQLSDLLKEVALKEKHVHQFDAWLGLFRKALLALPAWDKARENPEESLKKAVLPLLGRSPRDPRCRFRFAPPRSVRLVGSHAFQGALGPDATADVALEMPQECFEKTDFLNRRYHVKRALFLSVLASHLRKSELVEEMKFGWHRGNTATPTLLLRPSGNAGKHFRVCLLPYPCPEQFKETRFVPVRSNLRASWFYATSAGDKSAADELPSPRYNASVLSDMKMVANAEFLAEKLADASAAVEAILLLKVWLKKRQLDQGPGAFSGFLMAMYVVHLLQQRQISAMMSSYQIARFVLLTLDHCYALVDRGPPADSPDAPAFRAFWGDRSELRRFQDGSILEAVVWPAKNAQERRGLVLDISRHILARHAGLNGLTTVGDFLDPLLQLPTVEFPSATPYGTGEEVTTELVAAYDDLARVLRRLHDLPLTVSSVRGTSPTLRSTEVFPPLVGALGTDYGAYFTTDDGFLCPLPFKAHVPHLVPLTRVVVHMEATGKWPDDLEALRRVKAAFHVTLAKMLRENAKLVTTAHPEHVDVLKDGFVFRLRIAAHKEIGLARQSVGPNGAIAIKDTDLSRKIEFETEILPSLTSTLHGLQQQHSTFSAACRLAKRWVASQLLSGHMTEECIELLVASVYVAPAPYAVPNHLSAPFIFIFFSLPTSEDEEADIHSTFVGQRSTLPPMFLATPLDGQQRSRWTEHAPTGQILHRLVALARESLRVLEGQVACPLEADVRQIFRPPLDPYDVIIHLDERRLPTAHLAVDCSHRTTLKRRKDDCMPVVDFDIAALYVQALQETYGDLALFFYDRYGGNLVAVLWKPHAFQPLPFKVSQIGGRTLNAEGKMVPNVEAVLEDFSTLGKGLVTSVETRTSKWTV
ncbi:nucleolar RNA-associated protein, putative [Ixodes scapularis]|uniref:Nucleolar protein 6 n=1 Tax=Ixodes scapularis TaxID=6945 RepID=B7QAN8_IXOSC|nr:nucleolar RNA-associated protein, putative [Ixodes scapularis]|eukprot:XP_002412614.1 nucleolar RNA-associated protein, putative [Ixodes scapularis]